jgi:hypothetical protein
MKSVGPMCWVGPNQADQSRWTGGRIHTNPERWRLSRFASQWRAALHSDDRRWRRHYDLLHRDQRGGERVADHCYCEVDERPSLVLLLRHFASCRRHGAVGRDGLDPIHQRLMRRVRYYRHANCHRFRRLNSHRNRCVNDPRRPGRNLHQNRRWRPRIAHRHCPACLEMSPNSSLVAPKGRDDLTGGNQQALRQFRRRLVILVAKGPNDGQSSLGRRRPTPPSPHP